MCNNLQQMTLKPSYEHRKKTHVSKSSNYTLDINNIEYVYNIVNVRTAITSNTTS